jgi:hypothetical protein
MLNSFKSLWKCVVFILPILFILTGCGGGGGDSGGGGTPPPTAPTVLNYTVGQSSMTPLLTGAAASGMTFTVTHLDLAGSYNRSTYATTLLEYRGMSFDINQRPPVLGNGPMTIGITTPAGTTGTWTSGSNPTAGKFLVTVTARDQITVQVNSGGTGVDIYVLGALIPGGSLTWANFISAVETSNVPDVVLASLAYNALQTVYRCVSQTYTLIEVVMENQDTIAQGGINVTETSLPGFTANMSVGWGDADGNGEINPGDNFLIRFTNWWMDNPGSNQDYIYNGRVLWLDYWEGTNSGSTFVGGDFKIGVNGDDFNEQEVNSGAPDAGTKITYKESGFQFVLSW